MHRDIEQLLKEAENYEKKKKWDDLFVLHRYIFEKYPSDLRSIASGYEAGLFLILTKKDFKGALKLFQGIKRRCRAEQVCISLARMHIGICYLRMKEYERAKREFTALKKMAEKDIQTINNFLKFCERMIEKKKDGMR